MSKELRYQNLLNYPAYYKKRYQNLDSILMYNFDYKIIDDKIVAECKANTHNVLLIVQGTKITLDSRIFVDCSCESFKFEFAFAINQSNGLVYPGNYVTLTSKRPSGASKKNIFSYPTGCKHLIKLARMLYQLKNKIDVNRRLINDRTNTI